MIRHCAYQSPRADFVLQNMRFPVSGCLAAEWMRQPENQLPTNTAACRILAAHALRIRGQPESRSRVMPCFVIL